MMMTQWTKYNARYMYTNVKPSDFSGTDRPLYSAGLLPDHPNDPRSRAAPGLSGYSPKSGFASLPRLRKAFLRRQERIFLTIIILTYAKTSPLRTHTPDNNTYVTQWTRFMNISPLRDVGLSSIRSENKLAFPAPNSSGATVNGASNEGRRSRSLQMTRYFPGLYTTLDKLLRYTYYIMRSVIRSARLLKHKWLVENLTELIK